jgi:hypothetical protein
MNQTTLLYYYAHVYLPEIVFNHTDLFLGNAAKGPSSLKPLLHQTFNTVKNNPQLELAEKDITLSEADFDLSISALDNNTKLLLIKFPQPKNTAEVFYVGVYLDKEPKYFTLELHIPEEIELQIDPNMTNKYLFGQWVKAENKFQHRLLSPDFSEPRPGYLANAVNEYLKTA